ncbi:MAG: oligopeptide:H+ symporter [Endozoicomonas sp. (ex Botrylloides leachii)]|nr:oligopeptide:H+ symporter [Endozoicomonas sp. (ex Botrylloides leachii)]
MSQSFNVLKQPKPFYLIFFIELWERFGYYGLQALLAVYFVRKLGMSDIDSFITFGAFSALVYGLISVGGTIGDKVLGSKRTIVFGAIVLGIGYLLMASAGENRMMVYLGLGTIAVGNGLFKANPSSLLAKCYKEDDPRLDGAFTMYYMSINIGSLISMTATPYIADAYGWGMGFMTSVLGMALALLNYMITRHWIVDVGSEPDFKPVKFMTYVIAVVGTIAACFICGWILDHLTIAHILLAAVGTWVVTVFLKEIVTAHGNERGKMIVAFILMLQAIVFFVLYMQMPTSLNFFAINNVNPYILGIHINPLVFQSLNPFWIMVASPILAYIYNRSGSAGKDLSIPTKFALGMLCCAASFLVLPVGAKFANSQGIVSSNWIVLSYFLQSVGELLISALGLSMVAQLVPKRMHGFIMGAWLMTSSAASVLAGYIAGFTAVSESDKAAGPLHTLPVYSNVFQVIGLVTLGIALLMLITAPMLNRMMGIKDEHKKVQLSGV